MASGGVLGAARCWSLLVLMAYAGSAASAETEAIGMPDSRTQKAIELMDAFAERTGLTSDRPPQRYLWTDAFAVCNLLGLSRATGDERHRERALGLVDRVHHVLGRHRSDARRAGWISGLTEREGESRPTQGGLRIGKRLPERGPGDPFDERLEWDRDGQYFHYLTKWMHALDLVARSTRDERFSRWARELAARAYAAFRWAPPGGRSRLYWKMSIDLSRPLVPSMGQHDPLDGFVTLVQLQATAGALTASPAGPRLDAEIADLASMMKGQDWTTADPLGLGGLLMDACRVEQLMRQGAPLPAELLEELLAAATAGLSRYSRQGDLSEPASARLAFRELGLAIGLHAADHMGRALDEPKGSSKARPRVRQQLDALLRHAPLGAQIESFWLEPAHRRAATWTEHRDINEVMLATSLAPEGCLVLPPLR